MKSGGANQKLVWVVGVIVECSWEFPLEPAKAKSHPATKNEQEKNQLPRLQKSPHLHPP